MRSQSEGAHDDLVFDVMIATALLLDNIVVASKYGVISRLRENTVYYRGCS